MKSTLKIDVNGSNEPVIKAVAERTEDLRDKVMCKFFDALCPDGPNGKSNLIFAERVSSGAGTNTNSYDTYQLYPIYPSQEDRWINRLSIEQCKAIIPLAFQVLSNEDAKEVLKDVPFQTATSTEGKLPSKYQIDDEVSTEDIYDGQVVAVKFTVGKVYYDVLDKLTGKVIEEVDSALITEQSTVKLSQA